jgi:phosphohistidine phosphatase SixA
MHRYSLFTASLLLAFALVRGELSTPTGLEANPRTDIQAGAVPQSGPGKPAPDRAIHARATTLVLVRHAEKDPAGDARDPGLSAPGKARAQTLARMLGASQVTHLFASEFHRTQDTLAPLAAATGKKVEVVPAGKIDDLAKAIAALPEGSVAVIAGHSNTVPDIARRYGLEVPGAKPTAQGLALPDDAFDRLYLITLPSKDVAGSVATLFEMRYGE